MLKTKQIVVIGSVVVLMGLLLSLDIKGLVKPAERKDSTGAAEASAHQANTVTVEKVSILAKQELKGDLAQQISTLEEALKEAPADKKLEIQKQLAQKWDDVNQPAPAAFYYEEIALAEKSYPNWLKTGDLFTTAYQNTQDTMVQIGLVQKAINAYQKSLELNASSLDAQTGLGVAYISGTPNPMQGIQLLLGVVKKDPENVKANMNLGLFSIKSGQYDKAVGRFKTVVAKKPDPEAYFYLATSYESLHMKKEAIAAYEESKKLAADPNLTKFIDTKILELRKN
jgi:tetratricopeptide (TPR) repeat protein